MKLLAVSDSHGNTNALMRAVSLTGPDMILHLGDYERDCSIIRRNMPQIPVRAVRGNCDFRAKELDTDEFVVEGKRILMTHGHLFGVKLGTASLINNAMARGADIVLFGHTHAVYCEAFDGLLVVNPGSVGLGRKTYAVIEINNGKITCELKELEIWE